MTEMGMLLRLVGAKIEGSKDGDSKIVYQYPTSKSDPEVAPVFSVPLRPGLDMDNAPVEVVAKVRDSSSDQLVFQAPSLRGALLALSNQTFRAGLLWSMVCDLESSADDAEVIVNEYVALSEIMEIERDTQDLTMSQLSDIVLAMHNFTLKQ